MSNKRASYFRKHGWLTPSGAWYDEETGGVQVHLSKAIVGFLDASLAFRGKVFDPKDELHITILGKAPGRLVREAIERDPPVEGRIRQAIENANWAFRFQDKMYHVCKEKKVRHAQGDLNTLHAESIIVMVEVVGLQGFYDRLGRITGVDLEPPPAHVTLYTYGDPLGIGLYSREDLQEFVTQEIAPSELKGLSPANLDQVLMSLPEVQAGRGLWQNRFHQFDVYNHTLEFVRYVKMLTEDIDVIAAGYLHDIGKPVVAKPKYEEGVLQIAEAGTPYHTFDGHERVGEEMVREMDPRLFKKLAVDQGRVASLVGCHYKPMKGIKAMRKTMSYGDFLREYRRLQEELDSLPVSKEDVLMMFLADRLAQGEYCRDKEELLAIREALLEGEMDPRGIYEMQKEMYGDKE